MRHLDLECPQGHPWSVRLSDFRQGVCCATCSNDAKKKFSIEQVKNHIETEGYKLLSTEYLGADQKLNVLCPKGHSWAARFHLFRDGTRCPKCAGIAKLTFEEVSRYMLAQGYEVCSTKYINSKHKLDLKCPKNHSSSITWSDFNQGIRCSKCSGHRTSTFEEVESHLASEGYKLHSTTYIKNRAPLKIECPHGHIWDGSYGKFKEGYRCPKCAGNEKWTIEQIRELIEAENFQFFGQEYKDCETPLTVICPSGHEFKTSQKKWTQGYRCKTCWYDGLGGENHPNWNPNLTDEERQKARNYFEYYRWREAVSSRDHHSCTICASNERIVAHHLNGYRNNPEQRTDINNGVILCLKHHSDFHKVYGNRNNTREQFIEYLREHHKLDFDALNIQSTIASTSDIEAPLLASFSTI